MIFVGQQCAEALFFLVKCFIFVKVDTFNFEESAIEWIKKSALVLIDGDKLTSLMIEFGWDVQIERSFHIYKIDQDRFDEENF